MPTTEERRAQIAANVRAYRARAAEKGKCRRCGQRKPLAGLKECRECKEYNYWYKRDIADGKKKEVKRSPDVKKAKAAHAKPKPRSSRTTS